jgi:hypothetical protein
MHVQHIRDELHPCSKYFARLSFISGTKNLILFVQSRDDAAILLKAAAYKVMGSELDSLIVSGWLSQESVTHKECRTVATLMMMFWDLAPCRLDGRCQRFGEIYCLHFQRVSNDSVTEFWGHGNEHPTSTKMGISLPSE